MFANEGRVERVVLELFAAVRGRMGAKIMVETNMRRYDEGRRDGRKVGVATNLTMEEVAEDLVRLGQEATYGGLKCFKVDEMEEVDNGRGRSALISLLSPTGRVYRRSLGRQPG